MSSRPGPRVEADGAPASVPSSPRGLNQPDQLAPPSTENVCYSLASEPPRANTSSRPGAHDTMVGSPDAPAGGAPRLRHPAHDEPFQNVQVKPSGARVTTSTRSDPRTAVVSTRDCATCSDRMAAGPAPGPRGGVTTANQFERRPRANWNVS